MTPTTHRPVNLAAFLDLVGDDLGLDLDRDGGAAAPLTELPGWDSLHLLRLVVLMERETGRRVSVRRVLEARSLAEIHATMEDQA